MGDIGTLEVLGAVVGAVIAAGWPAYNTARRAGRAITEDHDHNRAEHATIFGLLGDLVHSIAALRERDDDVLERLERLERSDCEEE